MRRLARALPLLLILAVLLPGALGDVTGPLVATVTGPNALTPAQAAYYNVTITGGPGSGVNYTVSYYVTGTNTTGASPLISSPGKAQGNRTRYQLNLTSPSTEQTVTLVVTVEAFSSKAGIVENTTTSFAITITQPIVLTATFHNGGTTAAVNVTVRWYVDSVLVGTSEIKQIAANGDATTTFNYLPTGLSAGEHTVTAMADLDHNGVIDPARGEVATSSLFYNQAQPPAVGWAILLGIGIFLPVFIGVVALRRRGQR